MIRSAHFVADNPGAAACSAELSNPTPPSLKGAQALQHRTPSARLSSLVCCATTPPVKRSPTSATAKGL
jgi:hypothetical protein